jgi:hypothetical protein
MGEFFSALVGGVLIALFNKFVLSGEVCKLLTPHHDEDDDGQSSSSTATAEIHFHH